MKLAHLIDVWLIESGLKLDAVRERSGISRQTLHRWRSGLGVPNASNLDALGTALGKSKRERRSALDLLIEKQREA